jgi:hypothetical protein
MNIKGDNNYMYQVEAVMHAPYHIVTKFFEDFDLKKKWDTNTQNNKMEVMNVKRDRGV